MPQLPSGRHFALDYVPLWEAADAASAGSNIPAFMQIKTTADLAAYTRLLWLIPIGADSDEPVRLLDGSHAPPAGLTPIAAGFTAAQVDALATSVADEDMEAIKAFLQNDRNLQIQQQTLAKVQACQQALLDHPELSIRIQAGWAQLGVHPLQTGESESGLWKGAFDPPTP